MVGYDENRLAAQAKVLALHGGGDHLERLPGPDLVGQERVAAVQDVRDGPQLVGLERDGRVDAVEDDVAAVVLPGLDAVHGVVVVPDQLPAAVRVLPEPVPEGVFYHLLLLGRQGSRLGIEHAAFLPVRVGNGIVDPHVPQVQGLLQNLIGATPVGAVCGMRGNVLVGDPCLIGDEPCRRGLDIHDPNVLLMVFRHMERLDHELLDVLRGDPGGAQADLDLAGLQVLGDGGSKGVHVGPVGRVVLHRPLGFPELAADVAGQVLVGGLPFVL